MKKRKNTESSHPPRGLFKGGAIFLMIACAPLAHAANISWTGDFDSNWGDSRNWSPAVVPGAGDDVTINGSSVNAGGNRTVNSLTIHDSGISGMGALSATTLSVSGTAWIDADSASLAHLNVSSGTVRIDSVNLSSTSTWTGGRFESAAIEVQPQASVSIPTGVPDLAHTTLTNRGTVTQSAAGQLRGWENGIIENHATWNLTNTATPFTSLYGGNVFNHHGLLHKNGNAAETSLANNWTFNLNNHTRVDAGILNLVATTNLIDGAQLTGTGTIDIKGPANLSGIVNENIANLRLNSGGHLICTDTAAFNGSLTWIHGTISGTYNVRVGSSLEAQGTEIHRLDNYAGISNHGLIRWTGSGSIEFFENNLLHNHPDGTFEIAADGTPFKTLYGGNQLLNDGTIVRSTGAGVAMVQSVPFVNNGTLTCNSGTLELKSYSELNSGLSLSGTAAIHLNGDIRMNGTVSETVNSLKLTGATLTGNNACQFMGILEVEAGFLQGAIEVPQGSTIILTGESLKRLSGNSRIDVHGTLRWDGPSPFQFFENSIVHIHPNGVCDLTADGDPFDSVYGGNEIIIEGTFVKSAGAGESTTCDSPVIRQRGIIRCDVSTLTFTNTLYFEGNGTVTGTGNISLNGTMHLPGTVTVNGPTTWVAGSLTGTGGTINGLLEWTGGLSFGNWNIGNQGRLKVVDGTGALKRLSGSNQVEVFGVLEMASGTLQTYENTLIQIKTGGKVEGTGNTLMTSIYGGNVLEVEPGGLLTTTATGSLQLNNQVLNRGLVEPAAGTLSCNGGGGPSTGNFNADPGATLLFTGGTHELDASSTVTGTGDIRVTGGLVRAISPVDARIHLDGGTIEGLAPDGEFRFQSGSQWSKGYLSGIIAIPAGKTLDVNANAPGLRRLNYGAELGIEGTMKITGTGQIQAYEQNTIEVKSGGTLEMTTDGSPFVAVYGGSSLMNHGTILKSGGTADSAIQSVPGVNDGIIECRSGRITFNGTYTFEDGSTIQGAGRTALIAGTSTLSGTTTVSNSTLELAGAILSGAPGVLTGQNFEWSSGSISGVVTLNGVSSTTTGGVHRINYQAELRNSGVFTLGGSGNIQCWEQSTLRNLVDGTLNTADQASVSRVYGGNLFVNEGTLNIGTTTGSLTVNPPFEQTGTGRLIVGVAGLPNGFDRLVTTGTATLAGTLIANLEGGFNPPVGTSFEVVDAYSRVGTFSQVTAPRFDVTYPVVGDPPVSQNNVVLVARQGSDLSYEDWADDHSLTGNDALPGSDPDKDGNDNFTEYVLNMNPSVGDAVPLTKSVETHGGTRWIIIRYRTWDSRIAAGVGYHPETSTNLIDWHDTGIVDEVDPGAPVISGSEARWCRVPLDQAKKFLHLRFSRP